MTQRPAHESLKERFATELSWRIPTASWPVRWNATTQQTLKTKNCSQLGNSINGLYIKQYFPVHHMILCIKLPLSTTLSRECLGILSFCFPHLHAAKLWHIKENILLIYSLFKKRPKILWALFTTSRKWKTLKFPLDIPTNNLMSWNSGLMVKPHSHSHKHLLPSVVFNTSNAQFFVNVANPLRISQKSKFGVRLQTSGCLCCSQKTIAPIFYPPANHKLHNRRIGLPWARC